MFYFSHRVFLSGSGGTGEGGHGISPTVVGNAMGRAREGRGKTHQTMESGGFQKIQCTIASPLLKM